MKNGPNTSAEALTRRKLVTGVAQGLALGGLAASAAALGTGASPFPRASRIPVAIRGASAAAGHLLRSGGPFPAPETTERRRVVIVGGGIAGLSASWWLARHGVRDALLLELEDEVGGNARSGANAVSAFPWGAHYLPIPGHDAVYVRALLEELGIITGYDGAGRPVYDEFALCGAPLERLLIHGRWQDGLIPSVGATDDDRREYREFGALIAAYKAAVGSDGRRAFAIPVDRSSADATFRDLDRLSMADLLVQHGWRSPYLRWYIDYCCRDDFGTVAASTSAWAGIHYFAARDGAAGNAEAHAVLTWPEGNARLARGLRERSAGERRARALVYDVRGEATPSVDYLDLATERTHRVVADAVIFAAPRFVALRVLGAYRAAPPAWARDFTYAPWMVANVTLADLPDGDRSAAAKSWRFSWDNVAFTSRSLGYVNATHQSTAAHHRETVLTHYWPLTDSDPATERAAALARSPESWRALILDDLRRMHPGIDDHVKSVDVWLWGHGMVRPTPGFLWGGSREAAAAPLGRVFFAHSDMSGLSIFEEAQYRGVKAAEAVLSVLS